AGNALVAAAEVSAVDRAHNAVVRAESARSSRIDYALADLGLSSCCRAQGLRCCCVDRIVRALSVARAGTTGMVRRDSAHLTHFGAGAVRAGVVAISRNAQIVHAEGASAVVRIP